MEKPPILGTEAICLMGATPAGTEDASLIHQEANSVASPGSAGPSQRAHSGGLLLQLEVRANSARNHALLPRSES